MKLALTLALALATLLVPATAGAAERQARVHGGATIPITQAPFQAAIVRAGLPAVDGANTFCGGTIRDALHVITAAHCIFENGQAASPDALDVLVGTSDLGDEAAGQRRRVSAVSFDPSYGRTSPFAYDAALLTLETPLAPFPAPNVQPAALVQPSTWSGVRNVAGTQLVVSGWGEMESGGYPAQLRAASVPLVPDGTCDANYTPLGGIDEAVMLCAGDDVTDSCSGDSGGPLSLDVDPSSARQLELVGIVSFGADECSDADFPGVYAEIDGPLRAFVGTATPAPAPRSASAPGVTGTARVGDVVSCAPGAWSGSPSYSYRFARGATLVRGPSPDAAYTVQQGDVGAQLRCEVTATNAGGYGIAASAPTAPVEPAAAPDQAPAPLPLPLPAPPQPPPPRPVTATDRVAPVARIAKVTCSRTRCTLDARVRDAGFSSGVRRLEVKLVSRYRTRCAAGTRRVACTRIRARALRAASLGAASFRVRVTGLPAGRHTFTLRAVDVAGNRQAIPARRTVRTSGPR